jgi:putative SOS response-associated peptidase YedK
MCGRNRLTANAEQLKVAFGLERTFDLEPAFNIAPSEPIAIIRTPGELEMVVFGLIPPFAREPRVRFINARAETVATQAAFREAFRSRRCLVLSSGFYEWKVEGEAKKKRKQPFLVRLKSDEPFGMAGIWERYLFRETGEVVDSCAVITIPARPPVAEVHDRQPLILAPGAYAAWLDSSFEDPASLLEAVRVDELEMVLVNPKVSNARNKLPEDCAPIGDPVE